MKLNIKFRKHNFLKLRVYSEYFNDDIWGISRSSYNYVILHL